MTGAPTFPHRWVMEIWPDMPRAWHTRNDHLYFARYNEDLAATRNRRECTLEELVEIHAEYSQWGKQ